MNKGRPKKSARPKKTPTAIHGKMEDGTSVVGTFHLRVLIKAEGVHWIAQGLDIDYLAQGKSLDDAKTQFEEGLMATIHEHLKVHGNIEKVLVPAPIEVWKEFFHASTNTNPTIMRKEFSQISVHSLPFRGIDYIAAAA